MNSILIKPHHFIDIIKLYGCGIDRFVLMKKWDMIFIRLLMKLLITHLLI